MCSFGISCGRSITTYDVASAEGSFNAPFLS